MAAAVTRVVDPDEVHALLVDMEPWDEVLRQQGAPPGSVAVGVHS